MSSLAAAAAIGSATLNHDSPATAEHATQASAGAETGSSSWAGPPPSMWDRFRSLWIPTSAKQLWSAEQRTLEEIQFPFTSQLIPIQPDACMIPKGQTPETAEPWYINTVTIRNPALPVGTPLVLLHGFGAGIGLWISNFNHLASEFDRVDAIDMIGWGRSSRVDFEELLKRKVKAAGIKRKQKGVPKEVAEKEYLQAIATIAEDFTVDSLEAWRIRQGHDKIILCGHSMGGYLAGAYALKYPSRVENLILASPIGVPHKKELNIQLSWAGRRILSAARWAWWDASITPQSIVRALGRWGPKPVNGYVTKRFASSEAELEQRDAPQSAGGQRRHDTDGSSSSSDPAVVAPTVPTPTPLSKSEAGASLELDDSIEAAAKLSEALGTRFDKPIVAEYLYHICAQPGSGEFAFARLFDDSGFAYKPLIDSLARVSHGGLAPGDRMPITFAYGSHDWMDVNAGRATADLITRDGGVAQCVQIPKAGHQLFIDNPRGFITVMKQAVAFGKKARQQTQQE